MACMVLRIAVFAFLSTFFMAAFGNDGGGRRVVPLPTGEAGEFVGGAPGDKCWVSGTAYCPDNGLKCSAIACELTFLPGNPIGVWKCPAGAAQTEQIKGSYPEAEKSGRTGKEQKKNEDEIKCTRSYKCKAAGFSQGGACVTAEDTKNYCNPSLATGLPTEINPRTPSKPDPNSADCPKVVE